MLMIERRLFVFILVFNKKACHLNAYQSFVYF